MQQVGFPEWHPSVLFMLLHGHIYLSKHLSVGLALHRLALLGLLGLLGLAWLGFALAWLCLAFHGIAWLCLLGLAWRLNRGCTIHELLSLHD